jgi:hypothetical protein
MKMSKNAAAITATTARDRRKISRRLGKTRQLCDSRVRNPG